MERFVKGKVVVIPFPFSDLSSSKKRPALVLADLQGDDIILCQITSQKVRDEYSIPLTSSEFAKGSLHKPSNVRPNRLFTADKKSILRRVATINSEKHKPIIERLVNLINA